MHYWEPINATYKLDIAVVNPQVDPTFSFMTVDHDVQPEAVLGRESRGGLDIDQFGVVVRGCAGDGSIAGCSQPGE